MELHVAKRRFMSDSQREAAVSPAKKPRCASAGAFFVSEYAERYGAKASGAGVGPRAVKKDE
jgi:hypothetical protein